MFYLSVKLIKILIMDPLASNAGGTASDRRSSLAGCYHITQTGSRDTPNTRSFIQFL